MFAMPDAAQLVELAAALNLNLSRGEAEMYLPLIQNAMRDLDTFVQSRADESAPARLFPERGPSYRPSLAEDRYQAWLWKCAIGGGKKWATGRQNRQLQGSRERRRNPAGVHLAGHGRLHP